MNNKLEEVLEKYFGDEKVKFYSVPDAISNGQYIRWDYFQHQREKITIIIGFDDGETEVKMFTDEDELKLFIELILF